MNHSRGTYCKFYQLNASKLLANMIDYFDINEGFTGYIERMKEAQKIATTVDINLINDATLL